MIAYEIRLMTYDAAGQEIAETNGSGTLTRAEIFAGGRHLATWANSATYFNHADWLGTERARSNSSGVLCETITSLPFGDGQTTQQPNGGCGDPSPNHFTGLERDTESGLDHTLNRQFDSGHGRWLTPDPAGVQAVTLADPQTWNMYEYAHNNPTTVTDPSGLIALTLSNMAGNQLGCCEGAPDFGQGLFQDVGASEYSAEEYLEVAAFGAMPVRGSPTLAFIGATVGVLSQADPPAQQSSSAPPNSRTDIALVGREYTPRPEQSGLLMWQMFWYARPCTEDKCSAQTNENLNETITLVEKKGSEPWAPKGDPSKGEAHDQISGEAKSFNQHWFVDGKRVRLVVGRDD